MISTPIKLSATALIWAAVASLICLFTTQFAWAFDVELEWNRDFGRRGSVYYGRIIKIDEQILIGGFRSLGDRDGGLLWLGQLNDQMDDFEWEVEYGDSLHDGRFGQLHYFDGSLVAVTNQADVRDRRRLTRSLHFNYLDRNGDSLDWFEVPVNGEGGPSSRGSFIHEDGSIDVFVTSAANGEFDPFGLIRIDENHEVEFVRHYDGEEDFQDDRFNGVNRFNHLTSVTKLRDGGYIVTGPYYFDRWYDDLRQFGAPACVLKLSEDGDLDWMFIDVDSILMRAPDIYMFNSRGGMNAAFEHSSGAVYVTGSTDLWIDHIRANYGIYLTLYKFDPDGNLLWRRLYNDNWTIDPNATFFRHIVELRPDVLALFGHIRYRLNDERQPGLYVALMDTAGEMLADAFIRGEGIWDYSGDFREVVKVDSTQVLAILRGGDRVLSIRFDLEPPNHISSNDYDEGASTFLLSPVYPNPFNSSAVIRWQLPLAGHVSVAIFDSRGRRIDNILNGLMSPGTYTITWNGQGVPSGVYYCRIGTPQGEKSIKLHLVR